MKNKKNQRARWLDAWRGLALLSMVGFHGYYDLTRIFGQKALLLPAFLEHLWQQSILISFVFIAGCVSNYTVHSWKRGMVLCLWGLGLTGITHFFIPEETIIWGVLSFMGLGGVFLGFLAKAWERYCEKTSSGEQQKAALLNFVFFMVAFFCTEGLPRGFLGCYGNYFCKVPFTSNNFFLFILGWPTEGFFSADYVPLVPWLFLGAGGYFFWQLVRKQGEKLKGPRSLSFLGEHTLLIYLLHQPLLYGLCTLYFQH